MLLKSQYIIRSSTPSDNLALSSSPTKIYVGPYMDTIYGTKIAGDDRINPGEVLTKYTPPVSNPKSNENSYNTLRSDIKSQVSKRAPIAGIPRNTNSLIFTRYFFLDTRTKVFIESNESEVPYLNLIDINTYVPYFKLWYTSSKYGVQKNTNTVAELRKIGILKASPGEFVQNQTFLGTDSTPHAESYGEDSQGDITN